MAFRVGLRDHAHACFLVTRSAVSTLTTSPHRPSPPVLVTGATGYIGGRLVPRLLEAGRPVHCLVRDPRKLETRPWIGHPGVRVFAGDAADEAAVAAAMQGCEAAYYLVHSMIAAGRAYRERDLLLARTFAAAAARAGVGRIVYLGGLGETGAGLSAHLSSRREVEAALAAGPATVTVLRAAMIIGSGSASFEILRYLVERLPIMVTPRWVSVEVQPIAIRDALAYLVACLDEPRTAGRTLDIGGPDILTYRDLMQIAAGALGLRRRLIVPVPVLTPWLSSLWIHLVTPLDSRIARPLAEGLRNRVVCRDEAARELMPRPLLSVREAIAAAVAAARADLETSWLDAGPVPGDPEWSGGTVYEDRRSLEIAAPPAAVFAAVCRVGGSYGWYGWGPLWRLRGLIDRLAGGPGLSRGRRHRDRVEYGDVLDFWRVADYAQDERLVLRAQMRLPGLAVLAFAVEPLAEGRTRLVQTARFQPRGLLGLLYWWSVQPFHRLVFGRMLQGFRLAAESARFPQAAGGWYTPPQR